MAIPGSYWLLMQFIAFSMHQEHNHRQAKVWKFRFLILHFLSLTFVSSTVFKDHQKMSHLNFRAKIDQISFRVKYWFWRENSNGINDEPNFVLPSSSLNRNFPLLMHTCKSNTEVRDASDFKTGWEEIHIHGCVENRLFGARGLTCLCHCPNVFKAHSSAIMLFLTLC